MLICVLAQGALADDQWVCSFTPAGMQREPTLITYNVSGHDLTRVGSTGEASHFQILENDEFGLVGVLLTSTRQPNQTAQTIGLSTIVIDKKTKDFWQTAILNTQPHDGKVEHGVCVLHKAS